MFPIIVLLISNDGIKSNGKLSARPPNRSRQIIAGARFSSKPKGEAGN